MIAEAKDKTDRALYTAIETNYALPLNQVVQRATTLMNKDENKVRQIKLTDSLVLQNNGRFYFRLNPATEIFSPIDAGELPKAYKQGLEDNTISDNNAMSQLLQHILSYISTNLVRTDSCI